MVYFLKNLENFDRIPAILNEPIFQKGFEIAELSHLTAKQYDAYLKSLVDYSEVQNVSETAFNDGKIEGKIEGIMEEKRAVAKNMLGLGMSIETIATITGLSALEIEKLNNPHSDELNDEGYCFQPQLLGFRFRGC